MDDAAGSPLRAVRRRVRARLPVREYGTCSGVRVPGPAAPRRLFDRWVPGRETPEHLPFEGALAGVHRERTGPEDAVVIVGGGHGISTVAAARAGARVVVFEPSAARRRALRRTLRLNDADADVIAVRPEAVGGLAPAEAETKGLDPGATATIDPPALPPCDVLELDCEGAERQILRGLEAPLPRLVAVELHPIKLDGATDAVLAALADRGYEVVDRLTHDGASLDRAAFRALLDGEVPDVDEPDHQAFPPVAVAERDA